MSERTRPAARSLRAMYRRHAGVTAIAQELGVAYETARRWLVDAGVELRPKGRPSAHAAVLDVDLLAQRYAAGESIGELGEAFGVSSGTIRARLREAGVTLRRRPGWKY